jgi:hypothetical protein
MNHRIAQIVFLVAVVFACVVVTVGERAFAQAESRRSGLVVERDNTAPPPGTLGVPISAETPASTPPPATAASTPPPAEQEEAREPAERLRDVRLPSTGSGTCADGACDDREE